MIPLPLAERPKVRAAVIALARALLREAGVKPAELRRELEGDAHERAGPQLVTPEDKPISTALKRVGLKPQRERETQRLAANGEVVVPAGVRFTQCPPVRDPRFVVEGPVVGEFTRDWQAKRRGGANDDRPVTDLERGVAP